MIPSRSHRIVLFRLIVPKNHGFRSVIWLSLEIEMLQYDGSNVMRAYSCCEGFDFSWVVCLVMVEVLVMSSIEESGNEINP